MVRRGGVDDLGHGADGTLNPMPAARSRLTIAGIPVRIQPAFFILIVLLGLVSYPPVYAATWVGIATASVLIHELGHAVAFRFFGLRPSISLNAMGGLTSAAVDQPDTPAFTPGRSIVTSLAGPLSELVLLGIPAFLIIQGMGVDPFSLRWFHDVGMAVQTTSAGFGDDWVVATPFQVVLGQIAYINIVWSVLNLVPILPLDGGNVVASLVELVTPRHGRRVANVLSVAAAVTLSVWGWRNGFPVAALLAVIFVGTNLTELANSRNDGTDENLAAAARALVAFEPVRAQQLVTGVLDGRPDDERRRIATELFAWSRLAQGDPLGAQQAVASMAADAGPTATLRAAVSLAMGRTAEGVTTMAWAMVHDPDRSAKLLGAIAVAQSGQTDAVTSELLLLGEPGRSGATLLAELLERTGHGEDAARVGQRVATWFRAQR
jgi:stage IV sporulation protein FB